MPYRKGAAGRAERLHSLIVRSRGVCERCGKTGGPFEAAHIIRRRFVATRTDETAAWCLCHQCHTLVDGDAIAFLLLVEATVGRERYEELHRRAHQNVTVWRQSDWVVEAARLKALLAEVSA